MPSSETITELQIGSTGEYTFLPLCLSHTNLLGIIHLLPKVPHLVVSPGDFGKRWLYWTAVSKEEGATKKQLPLI